MKQRIGTFLGLLGILLVFLFVLTDLADKPNFAYFLLGVGSIVAGGVLWWRALAAAPPPASGRFRLFKRLANRKAKNK